MIRRILAASAVLSLLAGAASAQTTDFASTMAAGVEQLGQTVGEAALGGSSLFVTAKGQVPVDGPTAGVYTVTVEGQAPTAVEAAQIRDAKIDKLRAVARQFQVTMTLGDASYQATPLPVTPVTRPLPATPGTAPPAPPVPAPAPRSRPITANVVVHFSRPPEKSMPAFLDALRAAGVDTVPATNPVNPFGAAASFLGIGAVSDGVSQAVWDKAGVAAVVSARQQAEVLAQAAGRRLGEVRSLAVLAKAVQNGQAVVTVAVRFGFAS